MLLPGAEVGVEMKNYWLMVKFQFERIQKFWKSLVVIVAQLWMYLMPLNGHLIMIKIVRFIGYVFYNNKKVMFTVQLTKYSCESKDRKIKVNNIIQNMAFIWNHVKKQRVNRRIIVPAFTLDKSLVSTERMTPLRLNTLEQNTWAPNSPSPGNKTTSTPPQPTPPHLFPHRTPLMLVKCFICVSSCSFMIHSDISNRPEAANWHSGTKCVKWSMWKKNNSTDLTVHRRQPHCWEQHDSWPGSWGTAVSGPHLLSGRWLLPCTSPWLPKLPIFQEKLFWTNGNQTS